MGTIDEIKKMQSEGRGEGEIRATLKQRGVADQEVENGLSQAAIKDAVSQGQQQVAAPSPQGMSPGVQSQAPLQTQVQPVEQAQQPVEYSAQPQQGYEEMQPSVMQEQQGYDQGAPQDYGGSFQSGGGYPYDSGREQYQPYQEAMSSDVITEISEQVVSERLAGMQDKLEQAINFRTVAEAKLSSMDERLRRIEQIMDGLQMSLLQKVGEYVGDVKDIKTELVEMQKSFKKIAPELKKGKHSKGKSVP